MDFDVITWFRLEDFRGKVMVVMNKSNVLYE